MTSSSKQTSTGKLLMRTGIVTVGGAGYDDDDETDDDDDDDDDEDDDDVMTIAVVWSERMMMLVLLLFRWGGRDDAGNNEKVNMTIMAAVIITALTPGMTRTSGDTIIDYHIPTLAMHGCGVHRPEYTYDSRCAFAISTTHDHWEHLEMHADLVLAP